MMDPPAGSWLRQSHMLSNNMCVGMDNETARQFVVKSIACCDATKDELQALEEELLILQCLKESPGIVQCLGSSYTVENSVRFRNVFLEYLSAGNLANRIKEYGGHLPEPMIRVYTRQIAEGLKHMHDQGIVHCDVKAENVWTDFEYGWAKLVEFSSTKRMSCSNSREQPMRGTPLWMAPEVAAQVEQGPASDIWSLGCTVVEMAGGLPHDFQSLPDSLSEEAKDFLRKCFIPDPKLRWSSAQLLKHPFLNKLEKF